MTEDLAALERALARTALRMRVQCGLDWATRAVAAASLAWACLAAFSRDGLPAYALGSVAGSGAAAWLLGVLRPVARERAAGQIDRAYALAGRMRAAVTFLLEPPLRRAPFVRAALRDAARRADTVVARDVAPLQPPRHTWLAALALLGLLLLELAPTEPQPLLGMAAEPPRVVLLDRDELLGLQAELGTSRSAPAPELAQYEALLRRIELGDTAPSDLIARALALEAALERSADGAPTAEDRGLLAQLASELRGVSPALARALADDRGEAAQQLRALAERLQSNALTPHERRQLAEALGRARERERQRVVALRREEQLTRLLKRSEQAAPAAEEPSLLERRQERERELETLRRERERPLRRELQTLSRELAKIGDALSQQQPERAGEAARRAADALERFEQGQGRAERQRELRQAVAQLRELLQRRALAQQAESPSQPAAQARPSDDPQSAEARRQRFSERARGHAADAGSAGEPGAAEGDSEEASPALVLTPSSLQQRVETIDMSRSGAGTEHDSSRGTASARTRPDYQDLRLHGLPGAGPTRSQIIRSAAGAGFAAARYRKVYGDYREHAEVVLERDQVPAGYRFHVRRYFELVRPREGQDSR
ncbi:MAG: hypothetical protein JWN04_1660 [Myxococcaceae bacterium]|nr:hypothetical protein [Myxococcaceae bacterium]